MKNVDNKQREILGIILVLISVLLFIGFYSNTDAFLLKFIRDMVKDGIGVGGYVLPIIIGYFGISIVSHKKLSKLNKRFYSTLCFLITAYFIISLVTLDNYNRDGFISSIQAILNTHSYFHGGVLGLIVMKGMKSILGFTGSLTVLIALNIISLIVILDKSLYDLTAIFKKKVNSLIDTINKKRRKYQQVFPEPTQNDTEKNSKQNSSIVKFLFKSLSIEEPHKENIIQNNEEVQLTKEIKAEPIIPQPIKEIKPQPSVHIEKVKVEKKSMQDDEEINNDFLEDDAPKNARKELDEKQELKEKAEILRRTLESFRVKVNIKNFEKGPAVTRYEVELEKGVKVSKILNLSDDIALALATGGIRIEAPIPGKALVGIEVPNDVVSMIKFKSVLESEEFNSKKKYKIMIGLGKDISGKIVVSDLGSMPHLLIAGATGSGKSVCINTILVSIIYKYLPTQVKLILIDPKVVELNVYNDIAHLLIPVVTDPKKASSALKWAISEMTSRYNKFAEKGVRNIDSYNELYDKNLIEEKIPYIVIVIDELADLMMVCHNEVEDSIARLAQMARAAGMHLIIATQRPSVDVITGVIKANIPSRISFSVSSSIDSRTILDQSGAEKLLGRGDMLFYPMGYLKPQRVQGAFISEQEVEGFIKKVKEKYGTNVNYSEEIIEHINKEDTDENVYSSGDDELIDRALQIIIENNNATTSILQRKMKIGYNKAASIIEELEQRGIIGYRGTSTKREILIDLERE